MNNLGLRLKDRGQLADTKTWWRPAGAAGNSDAMFKLGLLRQRRGEPGEAKTWWRRAAAADKRS
jgi:hypothetical protein